MADINPTPTNAALSVLLTDVADGITNPAAHEAEGIIRLAAKRLAEADTEPTAEVVALITRLRQVAHETQDSATAAVLKAMLGEYAS
jgi:hypothetical protein